MLKLEWSSPVKFVSSSMIYGRTIFNKNMAAFDDRKLYQLLEINKKVKLLWRWKECSGKSSLAEFVKWWLNKKEDIVYKPMDM